MAKEILLGDEAVALGGLHSGISGAYSYPGTPATEIMEYIQRLSRKWPGVHCTWSANEKVAYEEALGMSAVGKRSMVSMKHVGLNVAADPFVNSAVTGAGGGMVLCVADDPGMHSSQNEQDSRCYAEFAMIPCLEPANQQEAYDATRFAFDLSEKYSVPVMIRLVTRLAHSRADVEVGHPRGQNDLSPNIDWKKWTLLPSNARVNFIKLVDKQAALAHEAHISPFSRLVEGEGERAYIVSGIAYNYFREALGAELPAHLKISHYPIPADLITRLAQGRSELVVIEEGYPFIESRLRGLLGTGTLKVLGKLSGLLPRTGELTPDIVAAAVRGEEPAAQKPLDLPGRPPQLCQGCSHADTYVALKEVLRDYAKAQVFSDIGCYTLGALAPYNSIKTCVDMGASVSMAAGAAHAGLHPSIAMIGDSTFGHSGMTSLLDAAYQNVRMLVIIGDNATTGMTGGQLSMTTGERLIEVLKGLGVAPEHIRVVEPIRKNHEELVRILKEEIEHDGLSVLIASRICIQEARKLKKKGS
jgi:indolepyruvate ferredoxin oxidoreductase alpha subunit